MAEPSSPGLYVHVPLCRSKCRYCGFFSVARTDLEPRWLAALAREAEAAAADWSTFDTLYVGGGTPSVLAEASIEEVMRVATQTLELDPAAERTLEVNPGDVTEARARHWRGLGFDRVSVGVQSFRDDELDWLGRRHDAATARQALEALRAAGFERIGIDLVQGLPKQSLDARLESLDGALGFEPDHLSCYELTVEPDTPLEGDVAAGRCSLPEPNAAADAFLAVSDHLRDRGFVHYEISNFARDEQSRSQHNQKYWNHTPYLGLGPAAHSFADGSRWSNVSSVQEYAKALAAGRDPASHREDLSEEQLRWERVFLGLRTSRGIALRDVSEPHEPPALARLEAQGFVRRDGDRLVPTVRGFVVADALSRELLFG
ncbi:MAG: radical SAM family heme chaperone HemW [Deltaproteobacteria bacterium]|jgi:oxygen-independent coproporphyrinogen-3 oxidase|nr:radical SAM family heme chaperone HemW [Deltaproteobacteria bacterium]MBW2531732.1 radical SAM family heme chaperone HemW [Deltaproteobacteria bacterium]